MTHDVIVVGGAFAGMSAALQLLRARRTVLVIDSGERRNRFASHAHGFLGNDGTPPGEIAAVARRQLEAYPTLDWIDARVTEVEGSKEAFAVTLEDGSRHKGRRLLLATGVKDDLPEIAGLAERWGRHVFHCPYCHGYELNQGPLGVIASGSMSIHQAELIPEWGPTTFFVNGALTLDEAQRASLTARNVAIEETPVTGIEGEAEVRLADGRLIALAGLFVASRTTPATPLAERLGCRLEETMLGLQIATDPMKETSIAGAFAAGDVARMPHSVALAVADGAFAGAAVHRSLVF
ncbi:NAD(P)/FAD-dependent oxidoreductase [Martelella endophytica]|uniref:Thioredoxin reductase n=1 Tax=Martelella endophytica TaxID=1486262 RepID=A0A0D5LX05_MAREN|nr:NAD(P)/FAD-dependent oxidoreductase [Martelella endophytica]AJY47938.1 thioredoxin reductase [Martelella endophytica]